MAVEITINKDNGTVALRELARLIPTMDMVYELVERGYDVTAITRQVHQNDNGRAREHFMGS